MDGERIADFLFLGLTILPPGLFATDHPVAALLLFFPLLFAACLAGSGPFDPEEPGEDAPP